MAPVAVKVQRRRHVREELEGKVKTERMGGSEGAGVGSFGKPRECYPYGTSYEARRILTLPGRARGRCILTSLSQPAGGLGDRSVNVTRFPLGWTQLIALLVVD